MILFVREAANTLVAMDSTSIDMQCSHIDTTIHTACTEIQEYLCYSDVLDNVYSEDLTSQVKVNEYFRGEIISKTQYEAKRN